MQPEIIYEDEFVLGLNKPSGLLVHPDGRSEEKTLVDWIRENRPEIEEVGEPFNIVQGKERVEIKRPGIVHRLDKETSGVILVAKTKEAHAFLKEQFQNRKVEKIYNAVVWGSFPSEKLVGVIDKPIGRSRGDFRKWSAELPKGETREAITEYRVLLQNQDFAYLEVQPKTGRTHQIRVHLKSISRPVICDSLYAPNKPKALGFTRLALHALSISLQLPNEKYIKIESALPQEFEEARLALK